MDLREGYDEYLNKIASDTGGEYLKNTAENIEYLKEVINERETVRNVITSEYLIAPTSKAATDSDGMPDELEVSGMPCYDVPGYEFPLDNSCFGKGA